MVPIVSLCAGQRQQEIVGVLGTKLQPQSKNFELAGIHIAVPSPLCTVVKNRILGKHISYKWHTAKPFHPPTNHSHHQEQIFEYPSTLTAHRLLKLSSNYHEFHTVSC